MKYLIRSLATFALLYGIAACLLASAVFADTVSLPLVTGLALATLLFQYLLGPTLIRWFFDIDWAAPLPARNQEFLDQLCRREGLPMPRVGIIHGAMPNAFTFGRLRSDASIVVTSGLIDALTPEEVNAVIAHEVGHIQHWDFLTMTLASIVPLLLYHLYALTSRLKRDHVVTWAAYVGYLASQFIVLYLSRTREYWADQYSARATQDPGALSTGLIKICYGLAKLQREDAYAAVHGDSHQKELARQTALLSGKIGVMGVSNAQAALLLTGTTPEGAAAAMRWDQVNPWARVYEFASTHPLTVHRLEALNDEAKLQGQEPAVSLPAGTRVNWSSFPVEGAIWITPWIFGIALYFSSVIGFTVESLRALTFGLAITWLLKIAFRYRGSFKQATIRTLIEDTEPSQMRPRAVRLEGEIVGRSNPEAFWSPDLVIKDGTGFLFVNDRQTIPFARLFEAGKADRWTGRRVTLEGWYRRGTVPYIELSHIRDLDSSDSHRSYSRWLQPIGVIGIAALLFWLSLARLN